MKVCHVTRQATAAKIEADGFRDGVVTHGIFGQLGWIMSSIDGKYFYLETGEGKPKKP